MYRIKRLAKAINQFSEEYDPYEYNDSVSDPRGFIRQLYFDILNGDVDHIVTWLENIIEGENQEEDVITAKKLLKQLQQVCE